MEYCGELVTEENAEYLQKKYKNDGFGNFLYFFEHEQSRLCIDATHSHSLGKFVNDSCHGNSVMQKIVVEKQPKLCIFALRDIENGEEITYNYGASGLWWRKHKDYKKKYNLYHLHPSSNKTQEQKVKSLTVTSDAVIEETNITDEAIKVLEENIECLDEEEEDDTVDFQYSSMSDLVKHLMIQSPEITDEEYVELHKEFAVNKTTDPVLQHIKSRIQAKKNTGEMGVELKDATSTSLDNKKCNEMNLTTKTTEKDKAKSVTDDYSGVSMQVFPTIQIKDGNVADNEEHEMNLTTKTTEKDNSKAVTDGASVSMEISPTLQFKNRDAKENEYLDPNKQEENKCFLKNSNMIKKQVTKFLQDAIRSLTNSSCQVVEKSKKTLPTEKKERRKVTCPVKDCNAKRSHLKEHLITIHRWTEVQASCARVNYNLNVERPKLPPDQRKSKVRKRTRRRCPFLFCQKEVVRMENHLKQFHNLSGVMYKYHLSQAQEVHSSKPQPLPTDLSEQNVGQEGGEDIYPPVQSSCDDLSDMMVEYNERRVGTMENDVAVTVESDVDSCLEEDCDYEDLDDKVIVISKMEEQFLALFQEWLMSCDGGFKKIRDANQHKNVIMSILHFLDSSGQNYAKLFSRPDLNQWITWFEDKGRKPGTIKTYLGSVKLFYEFVIITAPEYVKVTPIEINKMKSIVNRWSQNYNKKIKIAKNEKQLELLANLPTPEEICQLDESDKKKEALKTIDWFKCCDKCPSRKEFCLARDYLITYAVLNNASRSGCISNMTMAEYRSAEKQKNRSYIIAVKDHKTAATSGPAMLAIDSSLMNHLMNFVEHIRNRVEDITFEDKDPVFPSWSGKKMAPSMISTQMNNFWKSAGFDMSKKLNATIIRKLTTTAVHKNEPGLKKDLANLMNHDVRTAESDYYLQEKKKSVAQTSAKVQGIIRTNFNKKNECSDERLLDIFPGEVIAIDIIREKMAVCPELQDFTEKQLVDKIRYLKRKNVEKSGIMEEDKNVDDSNVVPDTSSEDDDDDVCKRLVYSDEENALIRREFKDLIKARKNISLEIVLKICKRSCLAELYKKIGIRRLLIKVRTERKKYHQKH